MAWRMKFQRYLETHLVPEWGTAYVQYGKLKHLIKQVFYHSGHRDARTILVSALNDNLKLFVEFNATQTSTFMDDYDFLNSRQDPVTKKQVLELKAAYLTLHKGLTFLSNYRVLNKLAFDKIVKKMDKNFHFGLRDSWLHGSVMASPLFDTFDIVDLQKKVLADLSRRVYFGNMSRAKSRVRREEYDEVRSYTRPVLRVGLMYGAGVGITGVVLLDVFLHDWRNEDVVSLLYLYGTVLLLPLVFLGLAICYHVWKRHRINFAFVMELDARSTLQPKQFAEVGAFGLFSWSVALFIAFKMYDLSPYIDYVLVGLLGLWLVMLLCPFKVWHYYSRKWFLHRMSHVLLPGRKYVSFADFFIADIMLSLGFLYVFFYVGTCYYVRHLDPLFMDAQFIRECTPTSSWIPLVLAGYPFLIRFIQCLRRVHDVPETGTLQTINAGKYLIGLVSLSFSSLWLYFGSRGLWAMWIITAVLYTIYATAWDILIDWGLFGSVLGRDRIRLLPPLVHTCAIVADVILRLVWISLLSTWVLSNGMVWGLGLAVLEVFRRCLWACLRVENEHANNVESFRAIKEIPVLYSRPPDDDDD